MFKYIRGWYDRKKIDSKTFERLQIAVNLAIYLIFEVKKILPQNIAIKIVFFFF